VKFTKIMRSFVIAAKPNKRTGKILTKQLSGIMLGIK
jgi:hypothetical protein